MTALERGREIGRRLSEVQGAREYAKEAEDIQKKLDLLLRKHSELAAAVGPALVLAKSGAITPQRLPEIEKTRQALERVSQTFEGTARSLVGGRNLDSLLKNLEGSTRSIAEEARRAWREHTRALPHVSEPLLERIEQIRTQAGAVSQLRSAVLQLKQCISTIPATQQEWDAYARARSRVEELAERLAAENFPEAVTEFCRAASTEGATLDMLTDEVRAWLKEEGILGNLRYRLL